MKMRIQGKIIDLEGIKKVKKYRKVLMIRYKDDTIVNVDYNTFKGAQDGKVQILQRLHFISIKQ